ncbi:MAG: DUF805 domain-containing protein [Deltaproteobacteria bacterium]|jgi:uncharacterized membrane protein YhaH (DUF805 family)|nr:DUF805 domain-containing protein [Deltaproteobacteria bacterium]
MESLQRDFLDVITQKFALFDGRARRREFWMFVLWMSGLLFALFLVGTILGVVIPFMPLLFYGLASLGSLAVLVPFLAIWTRRLHDMGQPGLWLLLNIVSLSLIPLIMAAIDSQPGDNKYGPNPKGF